MIYDNGDYIRPGWYINRSGLPRGAAYLER